MLKIWKKLWEPFRSCLLNTTANPAQFRWKWAGLAMLFSRQLPNGAYQYLNICNMQFNTITKTTSSLSVSWQINFCTSICAKIYLIIYFNTEKDRLLKSKHVWEYFLHNFNNFSGFIQRGFLCQNYNRKFWSYSMWPSKFQKGYKRWVEFSWR